MMCWPLSSVLPCMRTTRARPPSVRDASYSVTAAPRAASSTAAAQPAQPPPTTATCRRADRCSLAAHIGFPRQPQLADRRQRDPVLQNVIPVILDFCQERAVNGSHDQPRPLRSPVFPGQQRKRFVIDLLCAPGLECHQLFEVLAVAGIEQVGGAHIELLQLVDREIDAALAGIL